MDKRRSSDGQLTRIGRFFHLNDSPFDVVYGYKLAGEEPVTHAAAVAPYRAAGLTWWGESPEGASLAEMQAQIRRSPPYDKYEIHGDLLRKGQTHYPICTLGDDDRLIACTAINKTFNTAGLHCSNIIINNQAMRQKFIDALGFKTPNPFSISALIAAYNHGEEWLTQLNDYIDGNLAFVAGFLKTHMPAVRFRIPEGTYIGWMNFRGYGLTPAEVHRRIYLQANVVLEDGEMFGVEGTGYQRICTPSPRSLLQQALERIADQF